jgi:hypothetical protein
MKLSRIILFFAILSLAGCDRYGKNDDYSNIAGTKISIIAPPGFRASPNFIGLEKDAESGIQFIDLVGGNYDRNMATYTRDVFENQGLTVLEFKDLIIDGFKAKFAHVKTDEHSQNMMVVFGDSTFSVSAVAMFPTDSTGKVQSEIKQSLLTMKYDKNLKVDPFGAAYFKVLPNDSKFRFAKASGNMYVFPVNGVVKDSYENEPVVMVMPLPFDEKSATEDLMQSLVDGLIQSGLTVEDVKNTSENPINGYKAISSRYYFKLNGVDKLGYMAVIVKGRQALAFYGMTASDYDGNIVEFEKLLHSLRFK